jgi:hypothetical protein
MPELSPHSQSLFQVPVLTASGARARPLRTFQQSSVFELIMNVLLSVNFMLHLLDIPCEEKVTTISNALIASCAGNKVSRSFVSIKMYKDASIVY